MDNRAIYDSAVAYIESAGDEKYRQEDESYEPKEFLNFTFDKVLFHKNEVIQGGNLMKIIEANVVIRNCNFTQNIMR